jgi:ribosomal protein S18 acetylase RimI-like enzyme
MMSMIEIENRPLIDGLDFRSFELSDYEAMAELLNIASQHDGEDVTWTVAELRRMDQWIESFDPERDRVVARIGDRMIGTGRRQTAQALDGYRCYFHGFTLHPEWRRKGIGRCVLPYHESVLRERAMRDPDHATKVFQTFMLTDRRVGDDVLLRQEGYEPVRFAFDLTRPNMENIPDACLPRDVEIRAVESSQLRAIWDAKEEAFRDLWGSISPGEAAFKNWCEDPCWRRDLSCIAWSGDEVVGTVFVLVFDEDNQRQGRRRAYTENITVQRPWRRRGIATALIAQALRNLREAGFNEASLSVDTQNTSGACGLYESLGYQRMRKWSVYRKPL